MSWTDNSSNENQFKIERSTDGLTYTQIAAVSANVRSFADTGLTPGTRYFYRVRASNIIGDSAYSDVGSQIARGAATHLAINTASTTLAAGSAFSISVIALDQWNTQAPGAYEAFSKRVRG